MNSTCESQYEKEREDSKNYYLSLYFKPFYDEDDIVGSLDDIDFSTMLTFILDMDIADGNKREEFKTNFLKLFPEQDKEELLNYPYDFLSELQLNKIFHFMLYKKCLELLKNERYHDNLVEYCKIISMLYKESKLVCKKSI